MAATEDIQGLETGDRVRVDVWPSSWPDKEVEVIGREQDDVVVETDGGARYYLVPSYWGGEHGWVGGGQPWMRTVDGYESRGEIKEIIPLN